MGVWTNELTVMTKQGLNLIAKTPAGASYKLVKAVAGRGKTEPDPEKLSALTGVCDPVLEGVAMPAEYLGEQRAKITSVFNNALLTEGFDCWQVGVYALDPDEGAILFMIKQATVKDDIPSRAVMPLNITHRDVVFIGNASGIKYDPPDELLVYQAELKPMRVMAEEAHDAAQEALNAAREALRAVQEGVGDRGVVSDVPPDNPIDGLLWLKPIGELSLAGEIGAANVQPLNISGVYMSDTPPEDTSTLWAKPI